MIQLARSLEVFKKGLMNMKNYIVLLKQVPDIKEIDDSAFNKETGTLIRTKLKNVLNELDKQALSFTSRLKELEGGAGKIVCLTMGPPMAEEVLKYALARGVDSVILLSDRLLGGADTVATASPLASAIRKIQKEFFNDSDDYYIVSGMQSVDGDTAQVPAQVASDLEIPCIPFLTNVEKKESKIIFSKLTAEGEIKISLTGFPSLLTVSNYNVELYPSFEKTRYASKVQVTLWNASSVNDARYIGGNGSKTQVVQVFAPSKTKRKCVKIDSIEELSKIILSSLNKSNACKVGEKCYQYKMLEDRDSVFDHSYESLEKENESYKKVQEILVELNIKKAEEITDEIKNKIIEKSSLREQVVNEIILSYKQNTPTYKGDVFVVAEINFGKITTATFELLGKASELAKSLKVKTGVILIGNNIKKFHNELVFMGADVVYSVENKELEVFDPSIYSPILCKLLLKYSPQIVLCSATYQGRVLAPMASYRLACGLTADCTSLEIGDNSRKNEYGILLQTRPALGGNIMATICTKNSKIQMATARPGIMKACECNEKRKGKIIEEDIKINLAQKSFNVLEISSDENKVDFSKDMIIAGGRGLENKENFKLYIEDSAEKLSKYLGIHVSWGASRVAVEQGFANRQRQIGQTGTAVSPKVYIACGISGAIQHVIGLQGAETIISINNDKDAPICDMSDYYFIGNVEKVIPEILKAVKK